MWYVNQTQTQSQTESTTCFILTMWYVNNQLELILCDLKRGFILTMWYVNGLESGFTIFDYYTFYINYVVCK